MTQAFTFHRFGENALLLNFEQKIEEAVHQQVIELSTAIKLANLPSVTFTIPAYCSLTVGYDASVMDYDTICLLIENLAKVDKNEVKDKASRQLSIPACYDKEFGLDLVDLAKVKKLNLKEIIELHSSTTYKVFMLGFLPGFTYMGKLAKELYCKRKEEPRLKVPASSIGLAGTQTGIYPSDAPGGWQIIGRTPLPIFDAQKENPFLFQAGDSVQFHSITKREYASIQNDIATTSFNWQTIYG